MTMTRFFWILLFCLIPNLCLASYDEAMGKRHLTIAYALFWGISFAVIFIFGKKSARLSKELHDLTKRVDALEKKDQEGE